VDREGERKEESKPAKRTMAPACGERTRSVMDWRLRGELVRAT
jgi:hypothetical protein